MDDSEIERLSLIGKALSDPSRVRILLNFRGRTLSISTMTEELGTYQSNLSYHMSILVKAGLVTRVDTGKWHYYAVDPETLDLARRFVTQCSKRPRSRRQERGPTVFL